MQISRASVFTLRRLVLPPGLPPAFIAAQRKPIVSQMRRWGSGRPVQISSFFQKQVEDVSMPEITGSHNIHEVVYFYHLL